MKFFLVENKAICLGDEDFEIDSNNELIPIDREDSELMLRSEFETTYRCDEQFCCEGGSESDKQLCNALRRMYDAFRRSMKLFLLSGGKESECIGLRLSEEGSFLKDVSALVGGDNIRVKAKATLYEVQSSGLQLSDSASATTKEMVILYNSGKTCCQDMGFKVPEKWMDMLHGYDFELYCRLTVEVLINHQNQTDNHQSEIKPGQMIMHRMLHDVIHADVVIIPSNGTAVNCHKSVLSACSPVFETMFRTDMIESKTHEIEMPDMTEGGVRALLAYIYYHNFDWPNNDSGIALELLSAAHKYDVTPVLEPEMIKLLRSKTDEWFDLDVAVKLFLFARKLSTCEKLKIKMVQVLKRNVKRLPEVESYKEVFKDVEAAMELNQLFCT